MGMKAGRKKVADRQAAIIAVVRDVLHRYPEVQAGYLFGSVAAERAGPLSDVDVAVLFAAGLSPEHRYRLRNRLTLDLGEALGRREIDVVDLGEAPPLLAYEIIRTGYPAYVPDPAKAAAFRTRAVTRYLDTIHLRRVQAHYLLDRLRTGRFGRK